MSAVTTIVWAYTEDGAVPMTPAEQVADILEAARQPGVHTFAAPFAVPRTKCPGCREVMTPGRTVEYQPPEYPGGSQADVASMVLWHGQCAVIADREAQECACGERHYVEMSCLL